MGQKPVDPVLEALAGAIEAVHAAHRGVSQWAPSLRRRETLLRDLAEAKERLQRIYWGLE